MKKLCFISSGRFFRFALIFPVFAEIAITITPEYENTLQIFRLFRYSYPSSYLRCSLVASARLCCLSRVPPAVCPSLLESATTAVCTFCNLFYVRTSADASFHITIQARSTNTRFTYVQSSTLFRSLNLAFVY